MKIYILKKDVGYQEEDIIIHFVTEDKDLAMKVANDITAKQRHNLKITNQVNQIVNKQFGEGISIERLDEEVRLSKEMGILEIEWTDCQFHCIEVWENGKEVEEIVLGLDGEFSLV